MKVLRDLWIVVATKCREADRVASIESADPEATTPAERIGAFLHRMVCGSCRNAWQQIQSIDRALETDKEPEAPAQTMTEEERQRIQTKLRDTTE